MSKDNIGIDKGLSRQYDTQFPRSGVNQTSQVMRDNWEILKIAIENLQQKQIQVTGDIEGISSQIGAGIETISLDVTMADLSDLEPGRYELPTITVDSKGRVTKIEPFEGDLDQFFGQPRRPAYYKDLTGGVWNMDYGQANPVPNTWNDIETVRFFPRFDSSIYQTIKLGHNYDPTKPAVFETAWIILPSFVCPFRDGNDRLIFDKQSNFALNTRIEVGLEWKVSGGAWQGTQGINKPDLYNNLSTIFNGIQKITWTIPANTFGPCDIVQFRITRFAGKVPEETPDACDFPHRNKPNRNAFPVPPDVGNLFGKFIYESEPTRGSGIDTFDDGVDFIGATLQQMPDCGLFGFEKDLTSTVWNLDYGTAAIPSTRYDIETVLFQQCLDTVVYQDLMIPHTYDPQEPIVVETIWSIRDLQCDATVEIGFCFQKNGNGWGFINQDGVFEEGILSLDTSLNTETHDMQRISWTIPAGIFEPCDILSIKVGRFAEPPDGSKDRDNDACPEAEERYPLYFGKGNGLDNYCDAIDLFGGCLYSVKPSC